MLEQFDQELLNIERSTEDLRKVIRIILLFLGVPLAMLPYDDGGVYSVFMLWWVVWLYIYPYVEIRNGNNRISIYKILAWTPISRKDIQASRTRILNRYMLKLGTIVFILQQIGPALLGEWSIYNILAGLAGVFAMWLVGMSVIYIQA